MNGSPMYTRGLIQRLAPLAAVLAAMIVAGPARADVKQDLHAAVRAGQVERVGQLLDGVGNPAAAGMDKGWSLLHSAAQAGHVEVIRLLVARGMAVNSADAQGDTPLHVAAAALKTDAVAALIAAGAKVDARNNLGLAPLHAVASAPVQSDAAIQTQVGLIRQLLAAKADAAARDKDDLTPLHYAAARGRVGLIEPLVLAGAKTDTRDKLGRTPLHLAASGQQLDVMRDLIGRKAVVDAKDRRGETPLFYAARRFRSAAITLLIEKGAAVNAVNVDGMTPLIAAAAQGPDEPEIDHALCGVAETLCKHGANPAAKDAKGRTAQDHAREQAHPNLAKFLADQIR